MIYHRFAEVAAEDLRQSFYMGEGHTGNHIDKIDLLFNVHSTGEPGFSITSLSRLFPSIALGTPERTTGMA